MPEVLASVGVSSIRDSYRLILRAIDDYSAGVQYGTEKFKQNVCKSHRQVEDRSKWRANIPLAVLGGGSGVEGPVATEGEEGEGGFPVRIHPFLCHSFVQVLSFSLSLFSFVLFSFSLSFPFFGGLLGLLGAGEAGATTTERRMALWRTRELVIWLCREPNCCHDPFSSHVVG